jgi:glutamate synthase (NADPH/NADH) small chain
VSTKEFIGENGKVKALQGLSPEWKDGKPSEVPGSEFEIKADLVLFAMGFTNPVGRRARSLRRRQGCRGNAKATTDGDGCYATNVAKVFRRRRHASRSVAGGVGDSRRPSVRP